MPRRVSRSHAPGTVVHVEFGGDDSGPNDLLSCLSSLLSRFREGGSSHDVIIKPSELVGFQLRRLPSQSTATPKTTPDAFVFPKCIYLDQFLFHNLELANNKREMEREINAEIRELTAHRETLTHFNVSIIFLRRTACSSSYRKEIRLRICDLPFTITSMWLTLGTILCASKLSSARLLI